MPITPFHFGPAVACHALAPKRVSFLAFCLANVLIDLEPLYFLLTHHPPLHRFFHTYLGASLIVVLTLLIFLLARCFAWKFKRQNHLRRRSLAVPAVTTGALLGACSHILLDSFMHSDITPMAPFSQANPLWQLIPLAALHWGCVIAGLGGLLIILLRKKIGRQFVGPVT